MIGRLVRSGVPRTERVGNEFAVGTHGSTAQSLQLVQVTCSEDIVVVHCGSSSEYCQEQQHGSNKQAADLGHPVKNSLFCVFFVVLVCLFVVGVVSPRRNGFPLVKNCTRSGSWFGVVTVGYYLEFFMEKVGVCVY